jgi:hypothetical protein
MTIIRVRAQRRWVVLLLLAVLICSPPTQAQQLAPRVYWPAPVGTNVFIFGYQYSSGDILTDPTLPVDGVESKIHYGVLGYQKFFDLLGRTASIQVSAPYTYGITQGTLRDEFVSVDLRGMGDVTVRASANLSGAPAMDAQGMQALRANPRPIVGLSVTITAPTGSYQADKVLNIGTNRWSLRPALGVIWPLRPTWLLEAEVGPWLFADNENFLGFRRSQDPIWSGEVHLIKRIRPGFWASLDFNYYRGGRTYIEGQGGRDLQRNSRAGVTLVFPVHNTTALKFSYSEGVTTTSGGDYRLVMMQALFAWR